jgi:general secretion pathway protein N
MSRIRLSLALGWGLVMLSAASAEENVPGAQVAPQPRASALPWLKLEELTATRDRPLFTPDRRPLPPARPPPAVAAPPQRGKPRPNFALKGIIAEGSATFVLLEDVDSSESVVVRSGQKIGAWRVMVETDRSVALVGEGEEIRLQMFDEEAGPSK